MNIAILGPSGVGKGTHAVNLSARFNLRQLSTGDLLRNSLQSRSALGILARKYMEQGELVPDEVVDAMVEEWCYQRSPEEGTLFDGFPRTAYQAKFLDELLQRLDRSLDAVIHLTVPDDEIIRRLSGRLICRKCQAPYHRQLKPPKKTGVCDACGGELYQRPDDATAMVQARLRVFHRMAGPVIEHYLGTGKLVIVSGGGTIGDVGARLAGVLEAVRGGTCVFATPQAAASVSAPPWVAPPPEKAVRPTLDIVLLGGPGSGKGTQAELLGAQTRLAHIATGDLFRENLRQATELGRLAKTYMDRGELVPDDVTEAMVEERLARPDAANGFILDGFPRTLPQAGALEEMLARLERRLAGVLYINVSDEAIVGRLSGRLICRNCQVPYHRQLKPPKKAGVCDSCGGELYQRADDNPSTIRARLVTFHGQTEPLIDHYREAGLLHEISGENAVSEVAGRCLATVRGFPAARKIPAASAPPAS